MHDAGPPEVVTLDPDWRLSLAVFDAVSRPEMVGLPRHRHSLSRDEVELAQRARILAATARLVADRGYAAVSATAIAADAGVSSKTFYSCYPSKEAAFLGLYVVLDAAIELFGVALQECSTIDECVTVGASNYLRSLAESPVLARVLVVDALGSTPAIARRRIAALRAYAARLRAASFRLTGTAFPEDTVMAFVGAANELVYQRLLLEDPRPLTDLEPVLASLARRIVSGGEALATE